MTTICRVYSITEKRILVHLGSEKGGDGDFLL